VVFQNRCGVARYYSIGNKRPQYGFAILSLSRFTQAVPIKQRHSKRVSSECANGLTSCLPCYQIPDVSSCTQAPLREDCSTVPVPLHLPPSAPFVRHIYTMPNRFTAKRWDQKTRKPDHHHMMVRLLGIRKCAHVGWYIQVETCIL
jgi:hypothetical protein